MALETGLESIRPNVETLMSNIDSPARLKAIMTIAKKYNITPQEAQMRQALRIAQSQARK